MQTVLCRILSRLTAACVAVMLLACDFNGDWMMRERNLIKLQIGIATEADVTKIMGQAEKVWHNADSTRTLVYPMGPEGVHTWMVNVSLNGILTEVNQVLTEDNFNKVNVGMTHDEISRLLGKPKSVVQFKRKGEEVWDWKYKNVYEERFFNVHFDISSGLVLKTSYSEIFQR
jgi:hypothetical protein